MNVCKISSVSPSFTSRNNTQPKESVFHKAKERVYPSNADPMKLNLFYGYLAALAVAICGFAALMNKKFK